MRKVWATAALIVSFCAVPLWGTPSASVQQTPKGTPKSKPAEPKPSDATSPASTSPTSTPPSTKPVSSALHPMIVEVLYAVPTGMEGDANLDGARSATGDEFVEIANPHNKPIQLLGYSIGDESQGDKGKLRFSFPALELKPGEVAVVFNGYGASWRGSVGDAKAAGKKNEAFAGAYVFTMRAASNKVAFNNAGDSVTLYSPAGKPVQIVRWGTSLTSGAGGGEGVLDEGVPDAQKCSVQRSGVKPGDAWRMHTELLQAPFSPGKYDLDIREAEAEKKEPQVPEGERSPAKNTGGNP